MPYVVKNGIDGFVIPPNDPEILAKKLLELVLNKTLRSDMSLAGFERAKKEFDLNDIVDSLINMYQKILYNQ